jgi:hypothetical protein
MSKSLDRIRRKNAPASLALALSAIGAFSIGLYAWVGSARAWLVHTAFACCVASGVLGVVALRWAYHPQYGGAPGGRLATIALGLALLTFVAVAMASAV